MDDERSIKPRIENWHYIISEESANVYSLKAEDKSGRTITMQGIDIDELIESFEIKASEMNEKNI